MKSVNNVEPVSKTQKNDVLFSIIGEQKTVTLTKMYEFDKPRGRLKSP